MLLRDLYLKQDQIAADFRWFNNEEIAKVNDVLTLGSRREDADKIEYTYQDEKGGVVYTVAAEKDGTKERFITFYTNRKAPKSSLQNTQQSAQADQDAFNTAKVERNSDTTSVDGNNSTGTDVSPSKAGLENHEANDTKYRLREDGIADDKHATTDSRVRESIEKTAKRTGAKVNMLSSADEVNNEEAKRKIEAGENVTGWYDEATGKVYLYMPNIHDRYTAEKTIWHETVGHKGMRGLMGENYKRNLVCFRDPSGIQTHDLQNRNLTLYSAKLWGLSFVFGLQR